MKRTAFPRLTLALAAIAIVGCSEPTTTAPERNPRLLAPSLSESGAETTGRHLVLFESSAPSDFEARVAALGGSVTTRLDQIGVAVVEGLSDDAASKLGESDDIAEVGPDVVVELEAPVGTSEVEGVPGDVSPSSPGAPQTAFFFPRQWHLRAIRAHDVWASGKLGSGAVKVFILDTGIGYTHPDLVGRVDLTLSKSFIPSDDAIVASMFPGAHPIADLHFHGTHVGATVSSNAVAAAGVTSGVTLVGVKVLSRTGSGSSSGVLAGIVYAADNGADVINMSLGSTFRKSATGAGAFMAAINRATNYAFETGTLVVVSAGNAAADLDHDGDSFKSYCNAPNVVCVSATGPTAQAGVNGPWTNVDALAPYSNYGRSAIDVAAPGGAASFVWAACSRFSLNIPVCRTGTFVLGVTGTSMAAPHASAVSALLVEKLGKNKPDAVRAALAKTSDDLGKPGTDPSYGKGRVNALRAVQ